MSPVQLLSFNFIFSFLFRFGCHANCCSFNYLQDSAVLFHVECRLSFQHLKVNFKSSRLMLKVQTIEEISFLRHDSIQISMKSTWTTKSIAEDMLRLYMINLHWLVSLFFFFLLALDDITLYFSSFYPSDIERLGTTGSCLHLILRHPFPLLAHWSTGVEYIML